MDNLAIRTEKLSKIYRSDWLYKRIAALEALDLEVEEGEILGYLGPNGAGKTTTSKLLLGLSRPTSGTICFFGKPAADSDYRKDIGYLPENPYFYGYLTAEESLSFHGRLHGMNGWELRNRMDSLLALVGLEHARRRHLRKFSRGMLQRIGIAQALINDPKILILDEPMSGLDPMGRKQMRDIILGCRDQGKTVVFSSHILSDVEMMCDRAAIILQGRLQQVISVRQILDRRIQYWELTCTGLASALVEQVRQQMLETVRTGEQILFKAETEQVAHHAMKTIVEAGGRILSLVPQRESLEDIFVQQAGKKEKAKAKEKV